jgi:hypothetical protein
MHIQIDKTENGNTNKKEPAVLISCPQSPNFFQYDEYMPIFDEYMNGLANATFLLNSEKSIDEILESLSLEKHESITINEIKNALNFFLECFEVDSLK